MALNFAALKVDETLLAEPENRLFFERYKDENVTELLLRLKTTRAQKAVLQQIAARQKMRNKLPFFYHNPAVYYPPQVSLEQCSSEKAAKFKSTLFSGNTFLDLTAGMGIDGFFLSRHFDKAILVEPDQALASITSHNLATFGDTNHILMVPGVKADFFLQQFNGEADLIYIDPSRRDTAGSRVMRLQDCEPDVLHLMPAMFQISDRILIKTSPLLDITHTCKTLPHVKNVYVTELDQECRELLFEIEKGFEEAYQIHAVNLNNDSCFVFDSLEEKQNSAACCLPLRYLYEGGPALMKAGAFNSLQKKYSVFKLHPHSHLYTAEEYVHDFPGRKFEIIAVCKPSKNELQKVLTGNKANLSIRNFPSAVAELKRQWQIKDGGENYLFATTLLNEEKVVIVCRKP